MEPNVRTPARPAQRLPTTPRASGFKAWLGRLYLRLGGWSMFGAPPASTKYVVVGASHTSNWDGAVMVAYGFATGIRFRWTGKESLFRPPLGRLMRYLGGIPINRSSSEGRVEQLVRAFHEHDDLVLLVTPEGTRSAAPYWRTGFYYIALGAGVPLVVGTADFERRIVGFGPPFMPSGDLDEDLAIIRDFLADFVPKRPENVGPIATRAQVEADASSA